MENNTREIFKERLVIARKKKGVSRLKAAKEMDISRGSIDAYENGGRTPDVVNLKKIATYYNVSVDYLLGIKEHESDNDIFIEISDFLGVSARAVEAIKDLGEREKRMLSNILILGKTDINIRWRRIYDYFSILEGKRGNIVDLKNAKFMVDTLEYTNLKKVLSIYSNNQNVLQYANARPEVMHFVQHLKEAFEIYEYDFKEDIKYTELITVAQKELDYAIENNVLDDIENLNFMNMNKTQLCELLKENKNINNFFEYFEKKFFVYIFDTK